MHAWNKDLEGHGLWTEGFIRDLIESHSSGPLDAIPTLPPFRIIKPTLFLISVSLWYSGILLSPLLPGISVLYQNLVLSVPAYTESPHWDSQGPHAAGTVFSNVFCNTLVSGVCSGSSPGYDCLVGFLFSYRRLILARHSLISSDMLLHCLHGSSASLCHLLWDVTLTKLLRLILEMY